MNYDELPFWALIFLPVLLWGSTGLMVSLGLAGFPFGIHMARKNSRKKETSGGATFCDVCGERLESDLEKETGVCETCRTVDDSTAIIYKDFEGYS